jgi:hypothetical protein
LPEIRGGLVPAVSAFGEAKPAIVEPYDIGVL